MFRIELLQAQLQECEVCGRRVDGNRHHTSCPYYRLSRELESRREVRCDSCLSPTIEINSCRELECRRCHRVFVVRVRSGTIDTATLYRVGLKDWKRDQQIRAYVMPTLGNGDFPVDVRIAAAVTAVNAARQKRGLPPAFSADGARLDSART